MSFDVFINIDSRRYSGAPFETDELRHDAEERLMAVEIVLFACTHNAGRSQMAAAWFDTIADPTKARAISAGTAPGSSVHSEVVEVMRELGIDLSSASPRLLTTEIAATSSVLVTMGCGETCPVVPHVRREDWPLEDPKGKSAERVREIRDQIRVKVTALVDAHGWGLSGQVARPMPAEDRNAGIEPSTGRGR